jgi:type VI secretion system protein ImpF
MPRVNNDINLVPSVLDRLVDDQPGVGWEPATDRFQDLAGLKRAVARDLEALLNSRQETLEELPPEFAEVSHSVLTYGLPDFTSMSLRSDRDRNHMRRAVEQAIGLFEPRLTRVRVTVEAPREHDQALRFRIDALLRIEPAPEPVTFDARLQIDIQAYVVRT